MKGLYPIIDWEGVPQAVAFSYPYVIGFDPRFIEVRHVETASKKRTCFWLGIQSHTKTIGSSRVHWYKFLLVKTCGAYIIDKMPLPHLSFTVA